MSRDNLNGQTILGNNLDASQLEVSVSNLSGPVDCGVCEEQIDGGQWADHIQKEHNYIAWIKGNTPIVSILLEKYKIIDFFCSVGRVSHVFWIITFNFT